jgi:hypothetical protein
MFKNTKSCLLIALVCFALTVSFACLPGSRAQAQDPIDNLNAIQNGIKYFDGLIAEGKLSEDWRRTVGTIAVSLRNIKGFTEYVVTFTTKEGDPVPVTIFTNMRGEFSGSNLDSR